MESLKHPGRVRGQVWLCGGNSGGSPNDGDLVPDCMDDYFTFASAAGTIEAISDSASDTAAGVGARTVRVYGLDGDWNPIEEVLTMNGTSASSPSSLTFLRVNGARVESAGSTGYHVGVIRIRRVSGSVTEVQINPHTFVDNSSTETGHFSVPAGYIGVIDWLSASAGGTAAQQVSVRVREFGIPPRHIFNSYTGPVYTPTIWELGWELPPKTDVTMATHSNAWMDATLKIRLIKL